MSELEFLNIEPEELELKLKSLDINSHLQEVLTQARLLSTHNNLVQSNLCCEWILNHRPNFAPALIQIGSNCLKLRDFLGIDELYSNLAGGFTANIDQERLIRYIHCKALVELNDLVKARDRMGDIEEWEHKPLWYNLVEVDILYCSGEIKEVLELLDLKIDFYKDNIVFIKKKFEILNKTGQSSEAYKQVLDSLQKQQHRPSLKHYQPFEKQT